MSACDGHKEIGFARPTWSLPPHSPAGAFAPKDMASPLLTLSALPPAGLTSKPHHARRNFSGLRGSFCLRLASIFNHGRARTHPHYTRNSIRCQSRKGTKKEPARQEIARFRHQPYSPGERERAEALSQKKSSSTKRMETVCKLRESARGPQPSRIKTEPDETHGDGL